MRNVTRIATLLTLVAILLSACNSTTKKAVLGNAESTPTINGSITVALVTDAGSLDNGGFNQLAYEGYTRAQKQYGFKSIVFQAQTANSSEYIQNLRTAADEADLVIAVGLFMQNPLDIVAKQYPNQNFAIIDGCATSTASTTTCDNLPNVAALYFNEQEAGCIVGAMAAQMEVDGKAELPKLLGKNTIGAVGGLPTPQYTRYIAGYKYCAQKVDPSINVTITYSNDFANPATCQADAESQITDTQADILFQVAGDCGIGVLDAATEKGVYSIGSDLDQSQDSSGDTRPSVITTALKLMNNAIYNLINAAETNQYGTLIAHLQPFDLAHNGVGFATPSPDVPLDALQTAMNYENMIKKGQITPPTAILS
jgi:basic membrane protein A and related proteins